MLSHSPLAKDGSSSDHSVNFSTILQPDGVVSLSSEGFDLVSVNSDQILSSPDQIPGCAVENQPSEQAIIIDVTTDLAPIQTAPTVLITSPTTVSPFSLPDTPHRSASPESHLTAETLPCISPINTACVCMPIELEDQIIHDGSLTMTIDFSAPQGEQLLCKSYVVPPSLQLGLTRQRKLPTPAPVSPVQSENNETSSVCGCMTRLYKSFYLKIKTALRPAPPQQDCSYSPTIKLDG